METSFTRIEKAYRKEVVLLKDLLECLSLERDHLVDLNLEGLWALMERKKTVLKSIEETRTEIQALIKDKERAREASQEIQRLRAFFSRKIFT